MGPWSVSFWLFSSLFYDVIIRLATSVPSQLFLSPHMCVYECKDCGRAQEHFSVMYGRHIWPFSYVPWSYLLADFLFLCFQTAKYPLGVGKKWLKRPFRGVLFTNIKAIESCQGLLASPAFFPPEKGFTACSRTGIIYS